MLEVILTLSAVNTLLQLIAVVQRERALREHRRANGKGECDCG